MNSRAGRRYGHGRNAARPSPFAARASSSRHSTSPKALSSNCTGQTAANMACGPISGRATPILEGETRPGPPLG
eukprot:4076275-Lingulodinium_polyedra.AAC.1